MHPVLHIHRKNFTPRIEALLLKSGPYTEAELVELLEYAMFLWQPIADWLEELIARAKKRREEARLPLAA